MGSCIFQKEMKTIKTPYLRFSETFSYWAKSAKTWTQNHSTYYNWQIKQLFLQAESADAEGEGREQTLHLAPFPDLRDTQCAHGCPRQLLDAPKKQMHVLQAAGGSMKRGCCQLVGSSAAGMLLALSCCSAPAGQAGLKARGQSRSQSAQKLHNLKTITRLI